MKLEPIGEFVLSKREALSKDMIYFDLDNINKTMMNKPESALWSSPAYKLVGQLPYTTWFQWCKEEDFQEPMESFMHQIVTDGNERVLDLEASLNGYGPSIESITDEEWFSYAGLNFKKIRNMGYDAVFCSQRAAMDYHYPQYLRNGAKFSLNAWDCESTVWLSAEHILGFENLGLAKYLIRSDEEELYGSKL